MKHIIIDFHYDAGSKVPPGGEKGETDEKIMRNRCGTEDF